MSFIDDDNEKYYGEKDLIYYNLLCCLFALDLPFDETAYKKAMDYFKNNDDIFTCVCLAAAKGDIDYVKSNFKETSALNEYYKNEVSAVKEYIKTVLPIKYKDCDKLLPTSSIFGKCFYLY